jgi:hypothetical protein
MGSIPAILNARYVPSLLCRVQFNDASLPGMLSVQYYIMHIVRLHLNLVIKLVVFDMCCL